MIAKLIKMADGVVMAKPSPNVRVLWHHNSGEEHVVAYLGFNDADHAQHCYRWIAANFGAYDRKTNAGVCKPRKAERVDSCPLEIKWHCPDCPITQHKMVELVSINSTSPKKSEL